MASGRIQGITIEISGDTVKLQDSLKEVDKSLRDTQSKLKDVNKLLKLDPKNTELLSQKQDALKKAIADSRMKVIELNKTLGEMGERNSSNAESYDAIQREIIACQQQQKQWNAELSAMEPKVATIQDKLNAVSSATGKAAQATKGLSTAAGAAAVGLVGMATKAAADADDLLTLANQTGFTVEELQKMQYASSFIDVSMETMTGSITKLTKNMASGADVFDTLGISITDADGNMRSAIDVWYESVDALGKVANETERDQLSMALFGKSAMEMAGVVDDGGAALKTLGEEAESTGLILSGDAVSSAVAFNDQIDKLKNTATQAFFSAGASLAETLIPTLEKLVEVITGVLSWFGQLDGDTQTLILTILAMVAAISPVAKLLSGINTIATVLTATIGFLTSPIGLVVLAIGALVAAGVTLYQNWDTVKAKASELWSSIQTTFENIKSAISEKINAAKDTVMGAVETIKGAFNFSWSLPPIKLPHFSVSGGEPPWGLMGKGSLPKISIAWYKKAYDNPVMFTTPTVLATATGLKGFGDGTGAELVIGMNKLRDLVATSGNQININVYAAQGMSETAVANAVALRLDRWLGERV